MIEILLAEGDVAVRRDITSLAGSMRTEFMDSLAIGNEFQKHSWESFRPVTGPCLPGLITRHRYDLHHHPSKEPPPCAEHREHGGGGPPYWAIPCKVEDRIAELAGQIVEPSRSAPSPSSKNSSRRRSGKVGRQLPPGKEPVRIYRDRPATDDATAAASVDSQDRGRDLR
jgi:hypothetical protein